MTSVPYLIESLFVLSTCIFLISIYIVLPRFTLLVKAIGKLKIFMAKVIKLAKPMKEKSKGARSGLVDNKMFLTYRMVQNETEKSGF